MDFFFFKQKTAYEMRISDWSSDVCSSDLQYGLEALNAGTISVDQFLDLNDAAGGYDIDGQIVAERHQAAEEDVERIHSTGRVHSGGGDPQQIGRASGRDRGCQSV